MGVCNITPDSFSDGGRYLSQAAARVKVEQLLKEGADIVDIGGESTRPGANPVPAEEQLSRVLDVVRWAAARACVSIDTTDPLVADACLEVGAHVVNDVSMLANPGLASVAAKWGAALILSHARAPQATMSIPGGFPLEAYDDVVRDVLVDWERAAQVALSRGVKREALVMDPGLGFSKASRHSFELLQRARELVAGVGPIVPVLVGASHKSFLTLVDRTAQPGERVGASVAAAIHAARCGVRVLRVHDVRATRQAIDMDHALVTPFGHANPRGVPRTATAASGEGYL